jgi:hypothetical protein
MIIAGSDDLFGYVADLIETIERYGAIVLPPNDTSNVSLRPNGKDLVLRLGTRLPVPRRSRDVDLDLAERWSPHGRGSYALAEYGYELLDHEHDYRRALHRHDVDRFVRAYDVATHEHCEATVGRPSCGHYAGPPVRGAIDGFLRLCAVWVAGTKPDCSKSACLGLDR